MRRSLSGRKLSGAVIPAAIFVAMSVLLLATLLMATVSHDFGLSLLSVEATEFRYRSLGAANEMIARLNAGEIRPDSHPKGNPIRVPTDGRITESWVEPVPASEDDIFVVARTYRQSRGKAEDVRLLATYHEHTLARVYTNVTDTDKDNPDPIYFNDSGDAWSRVPDPPRKRLTEAGTVETVDGEFAGTIPYMTGSPDGSLYAVYAPVLDGWKDDPEPAFFDIVPFPVPMGWGDFALKIIVTGSHQGMTVGDLAPIPQVLVSNVNNVTVSRGAVFMKFSHDDGEWRVLPPPQEAKLVGDRFQLEPDNYHIQGVNSSPVAHDKGVSAAMFRKGQDSIYQFSDKTEQWTVLKPPGTDVLHLATDRAGTTYTQTGQLESVDLGYLAILLAAVTVAPNGYLGALYANTDVSALHRREGDRWIRLPDPPALFFDHDGALQASPYRGRRGPVLSGMVGGKEGELFVVNRPRDGGLADTIYKFSDGVWEVVPSPPNKHYDSEGEEVSRPGPPSRLEVCFGSDGQLIIRVPSATADGLDGIFVQNDRDPGRYDMLPPIASAGGAFEPNLSQMSVGKRRRDNGRGAYSVRATYF